MEVISTSIHTLTTTSFLPSHPPLKDSLLLLKPTHPTTTVFPSLSRKPSKSLRLSKPHSSSLSTPPPPKPHLTSASITHHKASAGYAAALLDISKCQNSIHVVNRDVRRLMCSVASILSDPLFSEEKKEEVAKGLVEGGGFVKQLVVLVRMLVGKGKVGLVWEVMEEFRRMYDELAGAPVVAPTA